MNDPDDEHSYGQVAYQAFMEPWDHDWFNAPNQRRWHRVGAAVIAAHKAACEPPSAPGSSISANADQSRGSAHYASDKTGADSL